MFLISGEYFSMDLIISCLSQSVEKLSVIEQIILSPPYASMRVCWGETALIFVLQMTETSNPKHGCVEEMHAFVHCRPVGMLTDDAPDSSPSLSTSLLLLYSHFQTLTDPNTPTPPQNMGENHGNTQLDYSLRTVIEYVTNTLRIALGNQIKK